MSQDGSFVGAFNLSTQAGVAAVLAAIRASQLSQSEKNELRDLVFTYTNGGGDASVRIALEQKLAAHSITPVVTQKGGVAAPALSFGTYRPTPNFKAPAATAAPTPAPQPSLTAPVGQAPVAPAQPPVQQPPVQPVAAPIPVASVPPPAPAPAQPAAPAPVASPVPPPVPPVPTPTPQPAPVQAVPPAPTPVMAAGQPEAVYLERIRQIKTEVNSKVGNPVNLVDINNAVGREYMNALLEAMKKLGSGAVSEMGPAMQRLEVAFSAVQVAIKEHEAKGGAAVPPPAPTPVPPVPPAPPVQQQSVPPAPVPPAPAQPAAPVPPPPVQVPRPPVADDERPMPPPPKPDTANAEIPRVPIMDVPLPAKVAVPPQETPNDKEDVSDDEVGPSGYDAVPPKPPVPTPTANHSAPSSLATERKLLTPNDLPDAASVETGDKGDPLFTKEVDAGLDQLLADWSLFKKSGLFGTGPKGREHPLYKKISGLQVPLLLAGRFDGANQEIRQSITDYMNGWRYEQGIIYQPGETFERYLRRVIKHILDLQKKRRGA